MGLALMLIVLLDGLWQGIRMRATLYEEAYDVFGRAADTGALKVVLTRS